VHTTYRDMNTDSCENRTEENSSCRESLRPERGKLHEGRIEGMKTEGKKERKYRLWRGN